MKKTSLLFSMLLVLASLPAFAEQPPEGGGLTQSARIVPKFIDGKPVGMAFYSIRPSSKLAQGGLKNGDVIVRINGLSMESPEKVLDVYKTLKPNTPAEVEVLRGNTSLQLRLEFL